MYVDESGDPGTIANGSSTRHFILSGLIIHSSEWKGCFDRLKTLRQHFKVQYGLPLKEEIHASELIRIKDIDSYRKIRKTHRMEMLKMISKEIPNMFSSCKIINICFDKEKHLDIVEFQSETWKRLIQRFDTFLKKNGDEKGIIISDETDEPLVRAMLRRMRVYNPVTSHFGGLYQPITDSILDDVFIRRSKHSYLIQMADTIAHILYRKEYPKGSLKKFNLDKYFDYLEPILLKEASKKDKLGIVRD